MKLKYLKTFEDFRDDDFTNIDIDEQEWLTKKPEDVEEEDCDTCSHEEEEEEETEESEPVRRKVWGDEIVEKKKMNAGFKAFLDKKKEKSGDKKSKPDFLDLDKDGDKKEPMKKAAKDSKSKGLTAGQKKLPKAMQEAIIKKQNKK